MTEAAARPMSIAEFLAADDGTDTRYELVDGRPVAMDPSRPNHARIAYNCAVVVDRAGATRRPSRALSRVCVLVSDQPCANVWIPDVAMTCEPIDDRPILEAPVLVVEVLSPSTQGFDKTTKLALYGRLPTVKEIWLVSSRRRAVLVYERREEWHAGLPYIGRASFASPVLGCAVALDELYDLTSLAAEDDL